VIAGGAAAEGDGGETGTGRDVGEEGEGCSGGCRGRWRFGFGAVAGEREGDECECENAEEIDHLVLDQFGAHIFSEDALTLTLSRRERELMPLGRGALLIIPAGGLCP